MPGVKLQSIFCSLDHARDEYPNPWLSLKRSGYLVLRCIVKRFVASFPTLNLEMLPAGRCSSALVQRRRSCWELEIGEPLYIYEGVSPRIQKAIIFNSVCTGACRSLFWSWGQGRVVSRSPRDGWLSRSTTRWNSVRSHLLACIFSIDYFVFFHVESVALPIETLWLDFAWTRACS